VAQLDKSLAATCLAELKKIDELEKKKNLEDKEKFKSLFQT
jgi:hypothetical protein